MSSSGQGGSQGSEDKPQGLAKLIRRASKAFKRDKSKRESISGASSLAPVKDSSAEAAPAPTPTSSAPAPAPIRTKADTTPILSVPASISQAIRDNKPSSTATKPRTGMTAAEESALQEEKARALFTKYGLTLEPGEWISPVKGEVERVEKKVRMRVRRNCHRCQTIFGADKICGNCQHTRCKKCPRYPDAKSKKQKGKGIAAAGVTAAESNNLQEEKARSLFAKYGMTLEPGEWTPAMKGNTERVEKKVRMRVHITCHRCQTMFGAEKSCNNCEHFRCKQCSRYPAPKKKALEGKGLAVEGIGVDDGTTQKSPNALTMPHRATGKELSRRSATQRVRRTCHKCENLFAGKATQCENCKHLRCPQCPRDPPKLLKYPDGYPGDSEEMFPLARREMRPIRQRVRWNCEECKTTFKDLEKACANCGHEKCDGCPRHPPKKEKQLLDEAAVRSVEERMKSMSVSPQASAA